MEHKKKMRRKKSVVFKDEPEILQTPPKTATLDKSALKSVLKRNNNLEVPQLSMMEPMNVQFI